ncbi:MAG: alkaline phosphatase family protein [Ignavibacteria bacterium]|nr:alkaline phosphatase family protein [Ignavibacteria bacterium]
MKVRICFILLFICSVKLFSQALQTQYIIIANIDGLRNNEGFESQNKNLRYIWDSLRPQGSIYTNFYNTEITVTNAGHSTIVTGSRQLLLNNDEIPTLLRPKEPTIGEYIRKYKGLDKNKVYFISGKNQIWKYPVSLYPGFGSDYEPTITLSSRFDTNTYRTTIEILKNYHPVLTYIVFAEVDEAGHTGDSNYYWGSIRQVDSLIYKLWKYIQSDSIYKDKTTLIVTSDHGRHSNLWQHHSDHCHGCRHILFLAIGPDIKVNTVIQNTRIQVDIAPTIGYLLNFPTPFAEGSIMNEMLVNPAIFNSKTIKPEQTSNEINVSNSAGMSRCASITKNNFGLHIVYSDNSYGKFKVIYKKSSDDGLTWSTPVILFQEELGEFIYPLIVSKGSDSLFVCAEGYIPNQDSSFIWILKARRSFDNGNYWENAVNIDTEFVVSSKPSISINGNKINVISQKFTSLVNNTSYDFGKTFMSENNLTFGTGYPNSPSSTIIDTTCFAVWQNLINMVFFNYMNIWFNREPWNYYPKIITYNTISSYSYDPSLTSDYTKKIHCSYSQLINPVSGNNWSINYKYSTNKGNDWSNSLNLSGSHIGFYPEIKFISTGKILCLWADYYNNQYSIWGTCSMNAGKNWIPPFQITTVGNLSTQPDFTSSADTIYLVWQDYKSGNWEIYFKKFILSQIASVPNSQNEIQYYKLYQNYPNPFNNSTKIKFDIPNKINKQVYKTQLKLYDITGKEIYTLIDSWLSSGSYEIILDARNLTSGIYFYHLISEDYHDVKKLILIK